MFISDIHLRDYHKFNKKTRERLNSFITLAEEVVKIGKERDIKTLLIGGDIVDKNTLTPVELHVLFKMFTVLASHFRIYSIIGNHDAKSKHEIDIEDTAITLLQEIDGITFHHQEVLDIGGRKIAFENWRPEYDLSWLGDVKPDIYLSHATIDYDETGIYGMDTSVFDGKFTLGVFGDIHVNRQLGNLISIGNTKQESLSDRHQGGVMIMDLDDLSYERVPIDTEHKKFLYLSPTQIEEEEGWVDKDGNDMTYKVYSPKKVGTAEVFEIPKITDIEKRTAEIMKKEGLESIHSEILKSCNHSSIDFNFEILSLEIENFRSISNYKWNLTENYIITGHNGSGKSSLITALFYALIGKKSLKTDITFGKSSCTLEVELMYQQQKYRIKRGTATGCYGLMVGDRWLKYNTKLEFEKDVYNYLPFLNYHSSFFFNYWDTELLSTLKVDKRYDLLSKYYRLDLLSSYHDIALDILKDEKKLLKSINIDLNSIESVKVSREDDLKLLSNFLKSKKSLMEIKDKLINYEKYKDLSKQYNEVLESINSNNWKIKSYKESLQMQISVINSLSGKLGNNIEKDNDLISRLKFVKVSFLKRKEFKNKLDEANSLLKELTLEKNHIEDSINRTYKSISDIKDIKEKEVDEKLLDRIKTLDDSISLLRTSSSEKLIDISNKISISEQTINSFIEDIKSLDDKKVAENTNSVQDHKISNYDDENLPVCDSCGQVIDIQKLIKSVNIKLEKEKSILKELNSKKEIFLKEKTESDIKIVNFKSEKDELVENNILLNQHNILVKKNLEKRSILQDTLNSLNKDLIKIKIKLDNSKSLISNLKEEFDGLKEVTEKEFLEASNTLLNIDLIKESKDKLSVLKNDLNPKIKELENEVNIHKIKLNSFKTKMVEEDDMNIEEVDEYKELKNKYALLEEYKKKLKKSESSLKSKTLEKERRQTEVNNLERYCMLTSRSGIIIKNILEDLTKTFTSPMFRFTTARIQSNGKVVADMSMEYLVGKRWIPYSSLSSGQRTLCDLYYLSKVITGVGIVSFDETLRFIDEENIKIAATLIDSIKKNGFLISSHSSNLSMEGTKSLSCSLMPNGETSINITV